MNNNSEDFFIGWKGNTSTEDKKRIKRVLVPIFIALPLLVFVIVFFAKPFGMGNFELGKVKEFTGTYYNEPFPVLLLEEGQLESGTSPAALLVGFGKNGAKTFLQEVEKDKGSLDGKKIKIQGTLIYGDGKTLIELTKKEKSLLDILDGQPLSNDGTTKSIIKVKGEIVDPKCWFGVMKPAEGKVHKSCAIRCISGGIPPVLRVKEGNKNEYYVLKGKNGEDINKKVLEFIGEDIQLEGEAYAVNGWKVMNVDPKRISYQE